MKVYTGVSRELSNTKIVRYVTVNGDDLDLRTDLPKPYDCLFDWGDTGIGAQHTAAAILADLCGDDAAKDAEARETMLALLLIEGPKGSRLWSFTDRTIAAFFEEHAPAVWARIY